MPNMTKKLTFTGKEFISEVLDKMPEAQEIFAAHGLACAGCHINIYETVEQGVLGHGMDMGDLERLIQDLNDAAENMSLHDGKTPKNPVITERAKEKIIEFQKAQDSEGFGFKIQVEEEMGELDYFLDFLEKPEKGDIIIASLGINLFLDKESLKILQNHVIDFGENENGDIGFKIDKI